MKQSIRLILGSAIFCLPMLFTSCGNIDNPLEELVASGALTPEPASPVKLTSITLNKPTTTILVGKTETLKVDAFAPDDATDKSVTWSSDKDAVATVDENGLVTAVAVGTAIITATAKDGSGVTDQCTVTVSVPGLLTGEFSVADGKKVRFAQGNLQAVCTSADNDASTQETWTWSFATNQWDYIGGRSGAGSEPLTGNNYIDGKGSVSTASTVDLFGWVGESSTTLTSGAAMYGISDAPTGGDYGTNSNTDMLKSDWGTLAISNGGDTPDYGWRTLTQPEWVYLLKTRDSGNTDDARFAKAKLFDTTYGLIIFPDNYKHPVGVDDPTGINKTDNTSWNANKYNADDWAKMEAAGCVFLPAAGDRNGTIINSPGGAGRYWSSTYNSWDYSRVTNFHGTEVNPEGGMIGRGSGCSVRLVQDVK